MANLPAAPTCALRPQGYPGHAHITVTYRLPHERNELSVELRAVVDEPTPVNLAQHSYFNLAGHASGRTVLDHVVRPRPRSPGPPCSTHSAAQAGAGPGGGKGASAVSRGERCWAWRVRRADVRAPVRTSAPPPSPPLCQVRPRVCAQVHMPTADHYTPVSASLIPTGEVLPVAGTPFDFTAPHAIGERIDKVRRALGTGGG